jgi:hypothetical protein
LKECKTELSTLPKVTKDAVTSMLGLIRDLADKVKGYADGSPSAPHLVQKNNVVFRKLNKDVLSTIPNFRPFADEKENDMFFLTFSTNKPIFLKEVKEYIDK